MFLVFDCETNGLPKSWKAPVTDLANWPRVTQLSWAVFLPSQECVIREFHKVRPDGWTVPKEKFFLDNGITTEDLLENGEPIEKVIDLFLLHAEVCKYLVAHNMPFDSKVVGAETLRLKRRGRGKLERICTMEAATSFCKLPGKRPGSYKWPKLEELHKKLFGTSFEDAHNALADVEACGRCFFELVRLGVIRIPNLIDNQ